MTDGTTPRFDPMTGKPLTLLPSQDPATYAEQAGIHAAPSQEPEQFMRTLPEPTPIRRMPTRAEIQEARRREREQGVEFPLPQTSKQLGFDVVARVRDLPFSDRVMLVGIPAELRYSLKSAMGIADLEISEESAAESIDVALQALSTLDDLAKAICCAGFIEPRLVVQEYQVEGDDCWLVDEIHPDERQAYYDFVMRDRAGSQQEVERLATFPGAAVEEAAAAGDRGGERDPSI